MACAVAQGDQLDLYDGICDEIGRWTAFPGGSDGDVVICLSSGRSFRYSVYPDYKANRADQPKPALLGLANQLLREYWYCGTAEGLEGDDVMGILANNLGDDDFVLVTIDKDLKQVPGWHWNPDKRGLPMFINEYEALYNLHLQWLTGDATDGYAGIPGIGPKKAAKMLESFWFEDTIEAAQGHTDTIEWYAAQDADSCIREFYKIKGLYPTYCHQMFECARILRVGMADVRIS